MKSWIKFQFRNRSKQAKVLLVLFSVLLISNSSFAQQMFFHLLGMDRYPAFTWTGNGSDALWTTAQNWSDNSVPGVGDKAHFIGSACTTNCSPTINTSISLLGLEMRVDYAGTITQGAGNTINIGTQGWLQNAGTFVGSDANITNAGDFLISSGTFTSTSAVFLQRGNFTISGGTYNHSNGRLRFDNQNTDATIRLKNITLNSTVNLFDLQYAGGISGSADPYTWNMVSGSFNVLNEFRMGRTQAGSSSSITANGGQIFLKGNLVLDQANITAGLSSGGGTTILTIDGTGNQTYSSATTGSAPAMIINKASGTFEPLPGDNSFLVDSFNLQAGSFLAPTGIFSVKKEFTLNSGTTFTHNSGTLAFDARSTLGSLNINLPGPLSVHHLVFSGGISGASTARTWTIIGGAITASGNLSTGNTATSAGSTGLVSVNGSSIEVSGNYSVNAYSGNGTTLITLKNGNAQSLSQSVTSAQFQGSTFTIDKSGGTSTQTTALSLEASTHNFNLNSGTHNMAGFNLTVSDELRVGLNGRLICNGGTPAAETFTILGEVSCGPTIGITWTGATGDNNWSTAGNWTNNTIPGATDIAIFNSKCAGLNCNANMPATVTVKGILLNSDYTGTLTAGTTLTVGTSGFVQYGGTFNGATATVNYPNSFQLYGGTYTASSGATNVNSTLYVSNTGSLVFNHNGGTFNFTAGSAGNLFVTPQTIDFNNVNMTGNALNYYITGEMSVIGAFYSSDTDCAGGGADLFSGTIAIKGNAQFVNCGFKNVGTIKIAGAANQTFTTVSTASLPNFEINKTGGTVTLNGTLRLTRTFRDLAGTVNVNGAKLLFRSVYNNDFVHTAGATVWADVEFYPYAGDTSFVGTLIVGGNLIIGDENLNSAGVFLSGTIEARGNVDFVRGGMLGTGTSTGVLRIAGSTNQTITSTSSTVVPVIPAFQVASTGGVVSYVGQMRFRTHYTYTSGTVDVGTSLVEFFGPYNSTTQLTPGPVSYGNVIIGGDSSNDFNITGTLTVLGSLTLSDGAAGSSTGVMTGGTILAYGDVILDRYGKTGYSTGTLLRIVGSTNQTLYGAGLEAMIPSFEIASTGGTVYLSGNIKNSGNYLYTSGTVNAGSSFLFFDVSGNITPGSPVYNSVLIRPRSSPGTYVIGTLKTAGLLALGETYAYSVNSGNFQVYGDFVATSEGVTGNGTTEFLGATTSYVSTILDSTQRHPSGLISVNKSSGASVILGNNLRFGESGQDLRVIAGTLNMAGSDLFVTDNVTIDPSGTIICNGGTLTRTSLTNNGVFDCSSTNFNWTGAGGNTDWNTAGNWSGGIVPGVNDVAMFSNAFCGSTCNATINVNPNVKGIRLASDYTGTITQGNFVEITIGSQGWVQNSGTFLGSNENKVLNGNMTISGGTYRATSATTQTGNNFGINNAPTFNHNYGTFKFTGITSGNIASLNARLYNVMLTGSNATFSLVGNTMYIDGDLTIGDFVSASGGVNTGTLIVGGDVSFVNFGYSGTANLTFFGGSASTLNVGASASVVNGDIKVEKLSMLTLTSAVTFTNPVSQKFDLIHGVIDLNGFTLSTRNLTLESLSGIVCRGGSYNSTSFLDRGAVLACAGYPYYWTGAGANANWNTAANWSGGVVPNNTATQVAIFSNSMCSSNCNPTLNVNPNVRGLYMMPDYTGTITQGSGIAVSIGLYGFNQAGGTFLGSNANVSILRRAMFGNGTFRAPTTSLIISSDDSYYPVFSGMGETTVFQHNNGTFNFRFSCVDNGKAHFYKNQIFYDLLLNNSCSEVDWYDTVLNVQNDLIMAEPSYTTTYRDLRIKVTGNVSSAETSAGIYGTYVVELTGRPAGQTISQTGTNGRISNLEINTGTHPVTITGTHKITRNYTYISSGTFTTTGSTLFFETANGSQSSFTVTPGSVNYNHVQIRLLNYGALIFNGTMNILGDLTIHRGGYGSNSINGGILAVGGNLTLVTGGNNPNSGTATVRLTGNPAGQIISGPENVYIPNLTIATGANAVTMSGFPRVNGLTTLTSGNVSQTGATFRTQSLVLGGNTWTKAGGVLNVNGTAIGTGALFGGTVAP